MQFDAAPEDGSLLLSNAAQNELAESKPRTRLYRLGIPARCVKGTTANPRLLARMPENPETCFKGGGDPGPFHRNLGICCEVAPPLPGVRTECAAYKPHKCTRGKFS